jgi:membrane protease YdiL (CAAX protease family)
MSITKDQLIRVIPLIPAALLFAGINAFNEEMYYRAPMLSTLPKLIGKNQAMFFNAIFFGLAHYLYGSPPGIIGAGMTGFLAWLISKSMLETSGLAWPWLIHFLPDAMIFFSYALLFVRI